MNDAAYPNAVTCPQCRRQLLVFTREADQGRCPLCKHVFSLPPLLEHAQSDDLPRLIPVTTGILDSDYFWNTGLLGGAGLIAVSLIWIAVSWWLNFEVHWTVVIPLVLGITAILRGLRRTIRSMFP